MAVLRWNELLDTCVFIYSTSHHESTFYTPFKVKFGCQASLPNHLDMKKANAEELLQEANEIKPIMLTSISSYEGSSTALRLRGKETSPLPRKSRKNNMMENMSFLHVLVLGLIPSE